MASKGTRDVDLVIRAKNEASKALDAVSSALSELTQNQEAAGKGSEKTGSLLNQLGTQIEKLAKQSGAFSRMEKMAENMDKAAGAVERLEKSVNDLTADQTALVTEIRKTEAALAGLNSRSQQTGETFERQSRILVEQKARVAALNSELSSAETELKKATGARNRYGKALQQSQNQLEQAARRHAELSQKVAETESPTKRLLTTLATAEKRMKQYANAVTIARTGFDGTNSSISQLSERVGTLKTSQSAATTVAESLAKSLAKTKAELDAVGGEVKTTAKNLTTLRNSAVRNIDALERQGAALATSRLEMAQLQSAAEASAGVMNKVGLAIRRNLLGTLNESQGELRQYREEWRRATAEIQRLASKGITVANPTPELQAQLLVARQAKDAYLDMQQAIEVMRRSLREAGQDTTKLAAAQGTINNALERVRNRTQMLANAQRQSGNAGNAAATAAVTSATRQVSAYDRATSAARRNAQATHDVASAMDLMAGRTRTSMSWVERLRGQLLALTSAYFGLYGAIDQLRAVTRAFMDMEAATSRMNVAFGGSTAMVGRELRWIEGLADRLGIQVGTLANEYSKLAVATRGTNLEGEETRKIFEAVAVAGRVSKLSLEQIQGTFLALTQMVSKGAVSMEELRRQLGDRLPGAFQIAARGMGISTKELDKLVSTGQLATADFLPKFRAELERTFGPQLAGAMDTFTAKLGKFQNEIFKARRTVAESGFIDGLTEGIEELTRQLKTEEGQQGLRNLGKATGALVKILAEIPRYTPAIMFFFSWIIGSRIALYFSEMANNLGRFTAAWKPLPTAINKASNATKTYAGLGSAVATQTQRNTTLLGRLRTSFIALGAGGRSAAAGMTVARTSALALNGALNLVRGTFALLGGLPGVIVTGLSFAFSYWLSSTGDVIDATTEHEQQMARVIDAYSLAKDKAGDWAKSVEGVSLAGASKNLNDLRSQLESQMPPLAQAIAGPLGGTIGLERGMFGEVGQEVGRLTTELMAGRLTVRDYSNALDEILKRSDVDDRIRDVIERSSELTDTAEKTEKALAEQAVVVQELGGNIGDLQPLVTALGIDMNTLAQGAGFAGDELNKKLVDPMEALKTQMEALQDKVPTLAGELKLLERLKEIDQILNTAGAIEGLDKTSKAYKDFLNLVDQARSDATNQFISGGSFVDKVVGVESGGDPNAKNPRSTATGMGQFIESTWISMFKKYFPDRAEGMTRAAILELRKNGDLSRQMVELYAQENAKFLQQAGLAVNDATLYLTHFLGPGGAIAVLTAKATDRIEGILSPDQISANESILSGKTAQEVYEWAKRKMGVTQTELALRQTMAKIDEDAAREEERRLNKASEYRSRLAEQLNLKRQEAEIGKQRTLEEEVQLALAKEQMAARRAGTELTQQEIDRITEITRLNWERLDQQRQLKEREEELNRLQQIRRDLMEQMDLARETGDTEQYETLKLALVDINQQLLEAIDGMIAFWTASGDTEKAQAAIAALNTLKAGIQAAGKQAGLTAYSLGEMTGQMVKGGLDNFLSKIRETGDVLGSLRDAFLQFASDFLLKIAQMILQQAVFNALQSSFGGGGFMGGFAGAFAFHTGGVVGSGDGTPRMASPSWFNNARRYHSGGIAGLRPNEVPAILERGEEVLTASDPRHSNNGGNSNNGGVQIINAIDTDQMAQAVLTSGTGKKAVLNLIKASKSEIKNILG